MAGLVTINDANYLYHLVPPGGQKKGLQARDYGTHPVGYLGCAKPFDLPLIPESEWQSRLDAQIAARAQLGEIRNKGLNGSPIPSRDQNGRGYCHSADTEVLTERGWVFWPDYNWRDLLATINPAGMMEFQHPFERHVYEYAGEMLHSSNRRLRFAVTPDHRMLVRPWSDEQRTLRNDYVFRPAADLGWYVGLMPAPSGHIGVELERIGIEGDREYLGDDFLALLAVFLSDGYVTDCEGHTGQIGFCCFTEQRHHDVAALAHRCGFKEVPSRRGVWCRYSAHGLAAWLKANCFTAPGLKAHAKQIPSLVKCASMRQIEHFLSFYGDQDQEPKHGAKFYSASRRIVDDLQELHLRIGKRGTITHRGERQSIIRQTGQVVSSRESWELYVAQADRLCIDKKKHIESDRYRGLVYCAAVPNGTLVTRHQGSVLISGNCWAHSSVSAALIARAVANEPFADLSAYAVACIIKNYRDEGGWGAESVEWIAANGCPTSEYWPQQGVKREYDTPAMRANAKLHRNLEWMDLDPRNMKAQLVTCLLLGIPVVSDFNWWFHSVCSIDLVSLSPFKTRIWNSWGDSWSENGTGILEGGKAIPDGALAVRVQSPAK